MHVYMYFIYSLVNYVVSEAAAPAGCQPHVDLCLVSQAISPLYVTVDA